MEKAAKTNALAIPDEVLMHKIYLIRGQKVMIDSDLSEQYGVETRRLNEQVKRNISRFPGDFMFQLSEDEFTNLKSQIATSSWGGRRKLSAEYDQPNALSSIVHSIKMSNMIFSEIFANIGLNQPTNYSFAFLCLPQTRNNQTIKILL